MHLVESPTPEERDAIRFRMLLGRLEKAANGRPDWRKELVDKAGVSHRDWGDIRTGKRLPTRTEVEAFVSAAGLHPGTLALGDEDWRAVLDDIEVPAPVAPQPEPTRNGREPFSAAAEPNVSSNDLVRPERLRAYATMLAAASDIPRTQDRLAAVTAIIDVLRGDL